jgi:hypothetical protein
MSSALAMILAAGMAIGTGPEMVSGEVVRGLDLRGEWEGTIRHSFGGDRPVVLDKDGVLTEDDGLISLGFFLEVSDEGKGKVQIRLGGSARVGIYKHEGEDVVICFCRVDRPTEFRAGNGRSLLILRRVKPGN